MLKGEKIKKQNKEIWVNSLTKFCSVKMAGYWPSLWTETESRSINSREGPTDKSKVPEPGGSDQQMQRLA